MPTKRFLGKQGTIQYGTGNLEGGPPAFYMVEFEGPKSRDNTFAISLDWLEALGGLCEHHWVIDSPAGSLSKGTCRSCGEERDFPNAPEGRYGAYVPSRVKTTEGSSTEEEERRQQSEDAAK